MKTIVTVLITIGIGVTLAFYYFLRVKGSEDMIKRQSWPVVAVLLILGFGLFAACINGASVYVHTINGYGKSDHSKAKYFLFYTAHFNDGSSKRTYLPLYGNDWIQNNTSSELSLHSIVYGHSESYAIQIIRPNTLSKASCNPSYFFEPIPARIIYRSRYKSSGRTKGLILKRGDPIKHKENNYPLF